MVAVRVYATESILFVFLVWNLILAFIPYTISSLLYSRPKVNGLLFYPLLAAWLLFFPNAPYMVTDLFHLRARPPIPYWFDLMLIFSFAWNGLLLGFVSLMDVQRVLANRWSRLFSWLTMVGVVVLSGFGVYLGRYVRFNSWDVLTSPEVVLGRIADIILNPFHHPQAYGVTILFSTFLFLSYLTWQQLGLTYFNRSR